MLRFVNLHENHAESCKVLIFIFALFFCSLFRVIILILNLHAGHLSCILKTSPRFCGCIVLQKIPITGYMFCSHVFCVSPLLLRLKKALMFWQFHKKIVFLQRNHLSFHTIGQGYKVDPATDLVPVCPNCHAMLQRGMNGEARNIDELKNLIKKDI